MTSQFSENLKMLRKRNDITQQELAQMLGYSSKNVSKWENGLSLPNIQTLNQLIDIFKLKSIDEILNSQIHLSNHDEEAKLISENFEIIVSEEVRFFYYLIRNTIKVNEEIMISDESYNALFVFTTMTKFKKLNIVESFEIINKEKNTSLNFSFSKIISSNIFKFESLLDVLMQIRFFKMEKIREQDYIQNLMKFNLGNQCLLVLENVMDQNLEFSLQNIYDFEVKNKKIQKLYPNNKDYKKIIRSNLSLLTDYGLVVKVKKGTYRRKQIIYNDLEYANYLLDYNIEFDFQKSILTKIINLKITNDDLVNAKIINSLYIFLESQRDLAIIEYFDINIKRVSLYEQLRFDIRVLLNEKINDDVAVYYK